MLKRLGKSLPKARVVNKSPQKGYQLNLQKTPPVEIYKEAIESLSHMKETFLTSKDISKSYLSKHSNSEIFKQFFNKNQENEPEDESNKYLNDSFGNSNTNKESNSNNRVTASTKRKNNNSNQIDNTGNENSFLTNNNNTLNILTGHDKKNSIDNEENTSNNDNRLELVMRILDLENLLHLFNSNKLIINDILFLAKEDLMEMCIPLVPRNRILRFSEHYKTFGKEFTMEEILDFFSKNKHFVYNKYVENNAYPLSNRNEEEKVNFYETNVLSTADFNNDLGGSSLNKKKNIYYEDEVFVPPNKISEIHNYTLANCVASNTTSKTSSPGIMSIRRKSHSTTGNNTKQNTIINEENEEKSIHTGRESKNIKVEVKDNCQNNIANINAGTCNVFANNLQENLNKENNVNNNKDNNNSSDREDIMTESIRNEDPDKNYPLKIYSGSNSNVNSQLPNNSNKFLSSMGFRKKNVIQKDFDAVTNEVEKYIKSYRELKVKSEKRTHNVKCLITKSKNSHSRSKSKEKLNNINQPFIRNNIPIYKKCHSKSYSNNFNPDIEVNINPSDLEIEEERNLNDEINKLLHIINSASQLTLDTQSMQQLNRIKSLANLNSGTVKNKKNLQMVDLDFINKEIDKLYEVWNEKQNIQHNLNKCNSNIVENKRLLRLLEDETLSIEKEISVRSYYCSSNRFSSHNNHNENIVNTGNETFNYIQSSCNSQSGIYYKKRLSKKSIK